MDEGNQPSRRLRLGPRPESSSSSHTRMTRTSSSNNSSSANLSRSLQTNRHGSQSGGSMLLQERLRERKVEGARQIRMSSVDLSTRETQSSPVRPHSIRDERRPSSSGMGAGNNMGAKQMEEQVSTLHKQNFDLKLEVHHRRERQAALEQQLQDVEKRLEDHTELQEVNDQLLAELEKRDQAVEEAVGIICNLEDRIAKLLQERDVVRNFDAQYDLGYVNNDGNMPSPPPLLAQKSVEKSIVRMPSFLSEQSEATGALRSLYLPSNCSFSDIGLPQLNEESDGMNSPRLSVLSESSFLSVYGDKNLQLNAEQTETIQERRNRKSTSVEKWIEERGSPNDVGNSSNKLPVRRPNNFLSIDNILDSPLQRLERLQKTLQKHNDNAMLRQGNGSPRAPREAGDALRRTQAANPSKLEHHPNILPPTPDTIGTSTLRHYQLSTDTLAHQSALSPTYLDATIKPAWFTSNLIRPLSAGETVTSRREGHGWDTETQEDALSTSSHGTASSPDPPPIQSPPTRSVLSPNLFDFTSSVNEWERQMKLTDSAQHYPSSAALRQKALRTRRASAHEPRSDDTVIPSPFRDSPNDSKKSPTAREPSETTLNSYGSAFIAPPDRRSSLSASTRIRQSLSITDQHQYQAKPPPLHRTTSQRTKRTSKYPNFNRTDKTSESTDELWERDNDRQRATPPPIMRNRSYIPTWGRPPSSGGERKAAGPAMGSGGGHSGALKNNGFDGACDFPAGDGRCSGVDAAGVAAEQGEVERILDSEREREVGRERISEDVEVATKKRWFGIGKRR